jgi:TPR repeat protein
MRALLIASFLVLTFALTASTAAQEIPVCRALIAEAELGSPQAQLRLGQAYLLRQNLEKAAYWWGKAARQGNAEAEMNLYVAYRDGGGVPRDVMSAMYWLDKAAGDGDPRALWQLGSYYASGDHVEHNGQKAFALYLRAAKQGWVQDQIIVAGMLEDGEDVPQDYGQAANWYKKAVNHVPDIDNTDEARLQLGYLYSDGNGVSQDYVSAYMYFALAKSIEDMQRLAAVMTPAQIAEAQSGAKEWVKGEAA